MKAYKVHPPLTDLIAEAYDRADGTLFFKLFDGREVCVTDFGAEIRLSTLDPKNPEQWVTADEMRTIMHEDEEAEYDRK